MSLRLAIWAGIAGIVGMTLAEAGCSSSSGAGGGGGGSDAGSSSGSGSSSSGSSSGSGSGSSSGSSDGGGDAAHEAGSSSGSGSGSSSGGHPVPGACKQTCDNGTPNGETGCNPCMQSNCPTEYAACQADNASGCVSCAALLAGGATGFSCANTDTLAGNLLACACQSSTCY